jgi:2-haloacid dehalogenase
MVNSIKNIVFDLGKVLIDHSPEYVYFDEFKGDSEKMNWFLENVCTSDWNLQQDAGRTIEEANLSKISAFPAYEKLIRTYYEKWPQMCAGSIEGSLKIFETLKKNKNYHCYALTNFSAETWLIAVEMFPYLNTFEGIIVSGIEKVVKPNPEIYYLLLERFQLIASESVFIDDRKENVEAAIELGFYGIHFTTPEQLKVELINLGIPL